MKSLRALLCLSSIWKILIVQLIVGCLPFTQSFAQSDEFEAYSSRPSILQVQPHQATFSPNFQKEWENLKRAQFAAAVEFLALYPDRDLFFLGRDAEMIFDAAQLVATAEGRKRLHLINVSRANAKSPHLVAYLRQNGLSEEAFQKGLRVVLIDTGFAGTISKEISRILPKYKTQIRTHLIVSGNPDHPSTRAFLNELNPAANKINLAMAHGTIVGYEHMPRFTDRSTAYRLVDGVWEPMSRRKGFQDGSVNKTVALNFMQDLKFSWNTPEFHALIKSYMWHWSHLSEIAMKQASSESLKDSLIKFLSLESDLTVIQRESIVRDLFESRINDSVLAEKFKQIELIDLGLGVGPIPSKSLKLEMAEKHPEWAPLLKDPQTEIPKLIEIGDFATLGAVIDAVPEYEILAVLVKALDASPWNARKQALIEALLAKNLVYIHCIVARLSLRQAPVPVVRETIEILLQSENNMVKHAIVQNLISQPRPRFAKIEDVILDIIKKSDAETRQSIGKVLLEADSIDESALSFAKKLLALNDRAINEGLAQTALKGDKIKDPEFWRLLIESGDQVELRLVAQYAFGSGDIEFKRPFLREVIAKGDQSVLRYLLNFAFSSKERRSKLNDELMQLASKADAQTANAIFKTISSRSDSVEPTTDPQWIAIKKALLIEAPVGEQRSGLAGSAIPKTPPSIPTSPSASYSPISLQLSPGEKIKVGELILEIVKKAGVGRRGLVFQVKDSKGEMFALKIAKSEDALESIANESAKASQWKSLGIEHAKVLVQGKEYVLKDWIEGISGEDIVKKNAAGDASVKTAIDSLLNLVENIRARGGYVGDFRPPNLIWSKTKWIMIDSGGVQTGLSPKDAAEKWQSSDERGEKFSRRWKIPLPPVAEPGNAKACSLAIQSLTLVEATF